MKYVQIILARQKISLKENSKIVPVHQILDQLLYKSFGYTYYIYVYIYIHIYIYIYREREREGDEVVDLVYISNVLICPDQTRSGESLFYSPPTSHLTRIYSRVFVHIQFVAINLLLVVSF